MAAPGGKAPDGACSAKALGVTIEAQYTVGEYDILILSAQQSTGLETWLRENGYRIPAGASEVLGSYLKQNMRFFVAKVNLAEQAKLGFTYLRPLQVAYESPKFMLPIRLGMVNADGPQELFVYALTRNGPRRDDELPDGAAALRHGPARLREGRVRRFYKAMFGGRSRSRTARGVLEYAWDMRWCDPCAADPLSNDELRQLGVFWLGGSPSNGGASAKIMPPRPIPFSGGGLPVMLTRIHVRYSPETFPEDLVFQETSDHENYQGRYVMRHAWKGSSDQCPAAKTYFDDLAKRRDTEATTLASLTGWPLDEIRKKMDLGGSKPKPEKWWEDLWK
jgi:hypothetical protein